MPSQQASCSPATLPNCKHQTKPDKGDKWKIGGQVKNYRKGDKGKIGKARYKTIGKAIRGRLEGQVKNYRKGDKWKIGGQAGVPSKLKDKRQVLSHFIRFSRRRFFNFIILSTLSLIRDSCMVPALTAASTASIAFL